MPHPASPPAPLQIDERNLERGAGYPCGAKAGRRRVACTGRELKYLFSNFPRNEWRKGEEFSPPRAQRYTKEKRAESRMRETEAAAGGSMAGVFPGCIIEQMFYFGKREIYQFVRQYSSNYQIS
jgi:hypothetical protein